MCSTARYARPTQKGAAMKSQSLYGPVKGFALIVILLMLVALLYSGYMSITHWTGIGV
jgi:hypothetical protein